MSMVRATGTATAKKATRRKATGTRKRVKFHIAAEPGSEVFVAGTFNGWNPKKNKLKTKNGVYEGTVLAEQGTHEYKFIVNGTWCADPECSEWAPNGMGSLNSVIKV